MSSPDFNTSAPGSKTTDGSFNDNASENFSQTPYPSTPSGDNTHKPRPSGLGAKTWTLIIAVALLFGLAGGVGGSYATRLLTNNSSTQQEMQAPGGQQNGTPPSGNPEGGNSSSDSSSS
jgi:hypothetical protein